MFFLVCPSADVFSVCHCPGIVFDIDRCPEFFFENGCQRLVFPEKIGETVAGVVIDPSGEVYAVGQHLFLFYPEFAGLSGDKVAESGY